MGSKIQTAIKGILKTTHIFTLLTPIIEPINAISHLI
jgi:hypothetical protein